MRPFRKAGFTIPLDTALEFLNDDEELFACLTRGGQPFKRSLPRSEALDPAVVQFLRGVLAFGRSQDSLEESSPLNTCYRNGWLQAEVSGGRKTYIFPTRLHQ